MTHTTVGKARGVTALIVLAASFALLTVLARYLNTGFTIAQQVYLRSFTAFVVAVMAFRRKIRWRRMVARVGRREWAVIALRACLLYAIGTTLYSKAASLAPVGDVSFIAALPLVSALGLVLHRATATLRQIGWVSGSGIGAAILSGFGGAGANGSPVWSLGDLLALVAMLAIAVSYIARAWHRPVSPTGEPLNNYEITALLIGIGTLCVIPLSLLNGEGLPHIRHTGQVWLWTAVAVAGTLNVLNVFLMNYAFEHVDPVRAGNLLTLECVWGLGFGFLFFGQIPRIAELLGGALIVACAIGLNLSQR